MIKIVKPGKHFLKYNYAICPKCRCEFKFDDSDIIHQENDGPNHSGADYIRCPNSCCKAFIWDWEEKEDFAEEENK